MSLSQGDFFYFVSDPTWDDPPHPKIVLMITDKKDVVYLSCTKDANYVVERCKIIEGASARTPYRTMVKITPSICPQSNSNTYLNCNDLFSLSERRIASSPKYSNRGGIPSSLFGEIKLAVLNSPNTPNTIRAILASPLKSTTR
jgi:hypothetical protein